jgi:hypothetical protein
LNGNPAITKVKYDYQPTDMEPTVEQLKAFYIRCVMASNVLKSIEMVRYDTRTKRIVMLVGETIEMEILDNGEVQIR